MLSKGSSFINNRCFDTIIVSNFLKIDIFVPKQHYRTFAQSFIGIFKNTKLQKTAKT